MVQMLLSSGLGSGACAEVAQAGILISPVSRGRSPYIHTKVWPTTLSPFAKAWADGIPPHFFDECRKAERYTKRVSDRGCKACRAAPDIGRPCPNKR